MTLIIATLGVGLVAGTVYAQDQIDYTEMVEDLKVMCRIIDETMDETFEKDYLRGGFFRRGGCQHLYLKGYGAMFLLDVQFPVAEKEMKVVKTEKKTNLWEKYEREVRHQRQPEEAAWVVDKNESYRKEKVDKLKEKLAYLVGEYGSRIGQLAFDDTISFVVFGHSGPAVHFDVDLDSEWHTVDVMSHSRETIEELREKLKELKEKHQTLLEEAEQILEAKRKLEGNAEEESQDNDKKVISRRNETIIIEEEKDEEIEDAQSKKGRRLHLRIPVTPIIPPPPTPISLPHKFRGKPATTLILTFKRSQLEGKKGADWEALLTAAEVMEY
jgi:hypothetical protein